MLAGSMTPENIRQAIADGGGSVTVRTLGDSTVTFTEENGTLKAALAEGGTAFVAPGAKQAGNGVVIPIDTVLLPTS